MKVIHSNERNTVGILSGVEGLTNLGLFNRRNILKIVQPVEYHEGVEAALDAAGLQEIP